MAVSMDEIIKASNGDMVGGQLLARVDNVNVVLGVLKSSTFELTSAGEAFAAKLDAPAAIPTKRHVEHPRHQTLHLKDDANPADKLES